MALAELPLLAGDQRVPAGRAAEVCNTVADGTGHGVGILTLFLPVILEGIAMNKTDLITHVADTAGISKDAASKTVDAVFGAITATLQGGGSITLVGFGTFSVATRAARVGRNPRTGAEIKIAASKAPTFKVGKGLKEAVNG